MSGIKVGGEVKIIKGWSVAIAAVLLSLFMKSGALADGPVLKFNDVVQEISVKGDIRIREEVFHRSDIDGSTTTASTSNRDRQRQRFRLRLMVDFKLPNNLEAKFQFASGGGEQVSTNQSFDNLSNEKAFWIDRAFLLWSALPSVKLAVGKMNNPFWMTYADDMVWDTDFNPEGAYEKFEFFGPLQTKFFGNALQMVVDEDSAGTQDQAMFGEQLGLETLVFDQSKLTLAVGLNDWINEKNNDFSQGASLAPVVQDGNRRTGNTLLNEFRVLEYSGEYATKLGSLPIAFQGTYIINTAADAVSLGSKENKGFQYGGILGKAIEAKTWEAAYLYKRVETDATIADVADSDFGSNGGTNRRGHIFWIAYAPTNWMRLSVKQFLTETLNISIAPTGKSVNRTQIDMTVKF